MDGVDTTIHYPLPTTHYPLTMSHPRRRMKRRRRDLAPRRLFASTGSFASTGFEQLTLPSSMRQPRTGDGGSTAQRRWLLKNSETVRPDSDRVWPPVQRHSLIFG